MIRGRMAMFELLCKQRGFTMEQVAGCIISREGDLVVVDETHDAYPHGPVRDFVSRRAAAKAAVARRLAENGPGTELKKLLAGFPLYIKTSAGCSCNKRATLMDINERREPGWCEKNIDTIVGWLKEEHAKRKILMPFSEIAVKQLVRWAIRRSKRANSQ